MMLPPAIRCRASAALRAMMHAAFLHAMRNGIYAYMAHIRVRLIIARYMQHVTMRYASMLFSGVQRGACRCCAARLIAVTFFDADAAA